MADFSEVTEKPKQKTYEEVQQEKQKLLFNLERLQKQGYPPSKKYSMASSFEDMQFEHDRLKKQRDVEKSIKFIPFLSNYSPETHHFPTVIFISRIFSVTRILWFINCNH